MTSASEPSSYDLVIIGAGEAGPAAAHLARTLGEKVAIIDRDLAGPEMWAMRTASRTRLLPPLDTHFVPLDPDAVRKFAARARGHLRDTRHLPTAEA